jgi:hypothetical protein
MKYFTPKFKLSADLPQQTALKEKVGGLPWGLSLERYPVCSDCGRSQTLIIQLVHHPERLDLGRSGRTLLVFQCTYEPGVCQTWDGSHGANACIILEPEELTSELTTLPSDAPELGIEAQITDWVPADDGIPPENVTPNGEVWCLPDDETMDDDAYFDMCYQAYGGTKLGGAPAWVQDQGEAPSPGWRFVAQLDEQFVLERKPSTTDAVTLDLIQRNHISVSRRLKEDSASKPRDKWEWIEDGTWQFTGPNLGCGLGYIFVQPLKCEPKGWFFWQC